MKPTKHKEQLNRAQKYIFTRNYWPDLMDCHKLPESQGIWSKWRIWCKVSKLSDLSSTDSSQWSPVKNTYLALQVEWAPCQDIAQVAGSMPLLPTSWWGWDFPIDQGSRIGQQQCAHLLLPPIQCKDLMNQLIWFGRCSHIIWLHGNQDSYQEPIFRLTASARKHFTGGRPNGWTASTGNLIWFRFRIQNQDLMQNLTLNLYPKSLCALANNSSFWDTILADALTMLQGYRNPSSAEECYHTGSSE